MTRILLTISIDEEMNRFIQAQTKDSEGVSSYFQRLIKSDMEKSVSKEHLFEQKRKQIQSIEDANHEIAKIDRKLQEIEHNQAVKQQRDNIPLINARERLVESLFSRGTINLSRVELDILKQLFKDSKYNQATFEKFLAEQGYGYDDHMNITKLAKIGG